LEQVAPQECGQKVSCNETPAVVDDEETIAIAIECKPGIRPFFDDAPLEFSAILRHQRVETMIRQVAIRLQIHSDKIDRQAPVHTLENGSNCAIAGIGDDFEPSAPQNVAIDQSENECHELVRQIEGAHAAGACCRRVGVVLNNTPQVLDAFGAAEQIRHLAHHLEAVVLLRIVRRCDHHSRQAEPGAAK
jgi:hypothetical protein